MEGTVIAQHNSSDTVCAALLLMLREQHLTEFIEEEREREVGAVTADGNLEGTVTAQHNSNDSVFCFVTAVKGTAGDRIYRGRE